MNNNKGLCEICKEEDFVVALESIRITKMDTWYYVDYHESCLERVLGNPETFKNDEIQAAVDIADAIKYNKTQRSKLIMAAKKKYKEFYKG